MSLICYLCLLSLPVTLSRIGINKYLSSVERIYIEGALILALAMTSNVIIVGFESSQNRSAILDLDLEIRDAAAASPPTRGCRAEGGALHLIIHQFR